MCLVHVLAQPGRRLQRSQDFPKGTATGTVGGESRDSHESAGLTGIYSVPDALLSPGQDQLPGLSLFTRPRAVGVF